MGGSDVAGVIMICRTIIYFIILDVAVNQIKRKSITVILMKCL
jgi:hypothetical protein